MLEVLLDSAKTEDWHRFVTPGLVGGVTTNPLLMQRAGLTVTDDSVASMASSLNRTAANAVPLQLQTWGNSVDEMTQRGRRMAQLGAVTVKVPATEAGFAVARMLVASGIPVTITAVYSAAQAMIAAGLGARYVAPYLGRMTDAGIDAEAVVEQVVEGFTRAGVETRILLASIRSPEMLSRFIALGATAATLSADVLAACMADRTSRAAIDAFDEITGTKTP